MRELFVSLRIQHSVKNFLIFLPIIFGRKLFDIPVVVKGIGVFFLFSMASSAAYLINDVVDIEKDKTHPAKRLRPVASGALTAQRALVTASLLGFVSVALSFMQWASLGWLILFYLCFNVVYSVILKDWVIVDVFCIGIFFLLRITAGSIAAGVVISHWILLMVMLLALFVGFGKRRHELTLLKENAQSHRKALERYNFDFIDRIITVITTSIVIVYLLYTVDTRTVDEFGTNHLIYSAVFVYYGIFRYLYLVHKKARGGDPVSIFLSDYKLQFSVGAWLAVCVAVIYFRV